MSLVRAQYHFRQTETGLDAWDIRKLIELTQTFPTRLIRPSDITDLEVNYWYSDPNAIPSPNSILDHIRLIETADISFPIILDQNGRVMDGMHRICRAILDKVDAIPAVQFRSDPTPDYKNCDPLSLPYID